MKGFMSDNTASVHPKIIEAISLANSGHAIPYGQDDISYRASKLIESTFGGQCHVSIVLNGTGANVVGLSTLLHPFDSVICPETAHINCDECGAFERYTGAKLIPVSTEDGKIRIKDIDPLLSAIGNEHHSQPRVVSISQITEEGTIYTIEEVAELAKYCHEKGLLLHVDGARISNACVALGVTFKEMIADTGVDLLSFGMAKNGLMYGEAIVSFHKSSSTLKYARKQGMQLMSKMRYISAQYEAILKDDLWWHNAKQANAMMTLLVNGLRQVDGFTIKNNPSGNIAFASIPTSVARALENMNYFYVMNESLDKSYIRLVTSFDTTEDEVNSFISLVEKVKV